MNSLLGYDVFEMSFLRIPRVACPAHCGSNGSVALHFARGLRSHN